VNELAGLRIVVTRASHQAPQLAEPLVAAGAEVILLPMIAIAPPDHPEDLRAAAAEAGSYSWIVFTSSNAVHAFTAQLPVQPQSLDQTVVAAVGTGTAQTAAGYGYRVGSVPEEYVAESLLQSFEENLTNVRILIPRAASARDVIPTELRKRGANVRVVEAYRNIVPPEAATDAPRIFQEPLPDWVIFASSSAADNLIRIVGTAVMERVRIASIGPVTTATCKRYGLAPFVESAEHNVDGLVESLKQAQR
jgi:uroporphyrinogen-III synthase